METSPKVDGGCLCGAVRFASSGKTLFCVHCHCQWCRRAHAAAFVTWLGMADDGFRIVAGEQGLRWYASSEHSDRGFCTTCGTTMLYRSKLAPGEIHIALGCVEGPVDRAPGAHVFYDSHVDWALVGDDLPKYERDHDMLKTYRPIKPSPR